MTLEKYEGNYLNKIKAQEKDLSKNDVEDKE
jgi:hypothetical protein